MHRPLASGGLSLADPRINAVTNECRKRAIRDPFSKFHHLDVTKIVSPMAPKMVPRSSEKQIRKMVKDKKKSNGSVPKNKIVVEKGAARNGA